MANLSDNYDQTTVRFVIFREEETFYGVALEFNIVKEGANALRVMRELEEATVAYFNTAKKKRLEPRGFKSGSRSWCSPR